MSAVAGDTGEVFHAGAEAGTAGADAPAPGAKLSGSPFWLNLEPEPIYAVLHEAEPGRRQTQQAALILPAFGWDDNCSYRSRRDWATELARAGIPTLRIDLPGTEDSVGSPLTPGRFRSWIAAADVASDWLRQRTGAERVIAMGIGLGGLLAYQAAAEGAGIDDLVLWGVRASGRALLRELQAYAAIVSGQIDEAGNARRTDGALDIGGYPLSAETAAQLSTIRLADEPLPNAERRRVLLLGRDALGVDERLRDGLAASGVALTVIETRDYYRAMAPPEFCISPTETLTNSIDWALDVGASQVATSSASAPRSSHEPPAASRAVEFSHRGVPIRERMIEFESSAGRLVGIVSEPVSGPRASCCLVVVNSGGLRRTAPNRLFVEVARRAAALGLPAARFDLPGLGDSDGKAIQSFARSSDNDADMLGVLGEMYDQLEHSGIADRFAATGLSLGGYLSILAALDDPRSIGAISANATTFKWSEAQRRRVMREIKLANVAGTEVLSPTVGRLRPGLRGVVRRLDRMRLVLDAVARRRLANVDWLWRLEHRAEIRNVAKILDELGTGGGQIMLILSDVERLLRILRQPALTRQLARYPNVMVERIPTIDHLLRPLWIQDLVIERVEIAVRALIAAGGQEQTGHVIRSAQPHRADM